MSNELEKVRSRRWRYSAVTALLFFAAVGLAQSPQGPAEVKGTLVFGTALEIRDAAKAIKSPTVLVPAGSIRGYEGLTLPKDVLRHLGQPQRSDDGVRRPFVVFAPDATPESVEALLQGRGLNVDRPPSLIDTPALLFQLGGQCPDCLPVAPGQPGAIPPGLIPQLAGRTLPVDRCRAAATTLRHRAQNQRDCFQPWSVNPSACAAPVEASAHVDEYLRACTATAESVGDINLSQLAVLALAGDGRPFCAALLVSPVLAITAAHCLFNAPLNQFRLRAWNDQVQEIGFVLQASSDVAESVDGERPVVLRLNAPASGAHASVCFEDPKAGDSLQLYGYLSPPAAEPAFLQQWKRNMRTGAFACSAVNTMAAPLAASLARNQCYRHSCQAFGGFSGSPIFKQAAGACRTLVVGMHVGAAGPSGTLCSNANTNSALSGTALARVLAAAIPPSPESAK